VRYRVLGTDESSRAPVDLTIEAKDEPAARRDAARRSIIVREVREAPAPEPRPAPLILIERTAKRWKAMMALALLVFIAGTALAAWLLLRSPRALAHPSPAAWAALGAATLGLAGLLLARLGAWWHHG
jgi:hypothetical protein